MNTASHSYDTSAVLPQILLAEVRQQPQCRFEVRKNCLPLCKISYSNFGMEEGLQASLEELLVFDYMLRANSLQLPAKHFFRILKFIPINTCAMVHLLLKMREQKLS